MRSARLDTFVPPSPSPLLVRAIAPVVKLICLAGIPVLREVPFVNRVPGICGLSDVIEIDLPRADELRLRAAVNPATSAFLAPNHPEFFTDWMLDKVITSRVAPLCGCWATHHIVNGLGAAAQWFWLKNGLIAQVPGAGAQGKAWSVEWALKGHGVLLHPEGDVGWHGDHVAPLFPGVVDMAVSAVRASRAAGDMRPAMIAPIVWKLRFTRDVEPRLRAEIAYTAGRLGLDAGTGDPAVQVVNLYEQLLARDEAAAGISGPGLSYAGRQARLLTELGQQLRAIVPELPVAAPVTGDLDSAFLEIAWDPVLRLAERRARQLDAEPSGRAKALLKTMRRSLRFQPSLYAGPRWSQEHVAENLKRIRYDYCSGTLRDTLNRYVPQPAGPRIASIRVPEPIEVGAILGDRTGLDEAATKAVLSDLRARMQTSLDKLAADALANAARTYDNPLS